VTDATNIGEDIHSIGISEIIKEIETSLLDHSNPDIYSAVKKDINK